MVVVDVVLAAAVFALVVVGVTVVHTESHAVFRRRWKVQNFQELEDLKQNLLAYVLQVRMKSV